MSRKNTWGLITVLLVVALTAGVIYFQTSARLKETDGKKSASFGNGPPRWSHVGDGSTGPSDRNFDA